MTLRCRKIRIFGENSSKRNFKNWCGIEKCSTGPKWLPEIESKEMGSKKITTRKEFSYWKVNKNGQLGIVVLTNGESYLILILSYKLIFEN